MKCQDVEWKIVSGEPLTGQEGLHLLECEECQKFAHAHQMLQDGGEATPDASLDEAVASAWQRETVLERRLRIARRVLMPVAAALLMLLGVWALRGGAGTSKVVEPQVAQTESAMKTELVEDAWTLGWETAEQELDELEIGLALLEMDKALSGQQTSVESLSYDMLSLEFGLEEL
ncbi:MAG: hypothetical protein IJJ26_12630 [Victivallales bacterium]|nr:hypothetical protein [Victivallales bacterium]